MGKTWKPPEKKNSQKRILVLFARNQLFWVKKLAIGASTDLINDRWLEIHHHAARHVFASTRLGKEPEHNRSVAR